MPNAAYTRRTMRFDKPFWDFANTPKANYPLLLHLPPAGDLPPSGVQAAGRGVWPCCCSVTNSPPRKNVAITITTRRSPRTTPRSQAVFFSIMASEIGYGEKGLRLLHANGATGFGQSASQHQHGLHLRRISRLVDGLVYGFAGMRSNAQTPQFTPFYHANGRIISSSCVCTDICCKCGLS